MPKLATPEEFMNATREKISRLPKNLIADYMPAIHELKQAGYKWAEIAQDLKDAGLEVKASHVKAAYFDAHPEARKPAKPKQPKAEGQRIEQPKAEQKQ